MNIKRVPIEQVQNWEDNPRNIKTKDFERLKRQIKELGVYKPMIACPENGGYTVLGGNMRLRALKELGIREVEISIVHPKSKAEKIKYALSDNDRAGEYEEEKLAELVYSHIDEIELGDYKIDVGEPVNLQDVIEDYAPNLDGSEDEIPEIDDSPAVTKTGDLFKLGRHRLLCGDATKEEDVKRLMNGEKADMVFIDPPYQMGKNIQNDNLKNGREFNQTWLKVLKNFFKTALYICYKPTALHDIICPADSMGLVFQRCFFVYKQNDETFPLRSWLRKSEAIMLFEKNPIDYLDIRPYAHDTYLITEIGKELPKGLIHPIVKNLSVVEDLIKRIKGKMVSDYFLGSGTTLIACEKLNRICYGMEIEPKYCDVTIKRYADYTGTPEEEIRETVEHG